MSAAWLDTEAAERAAAAWTTHADQLHGSAFQLEHLLAELALGEHTAPVQHLTTAATELWLLATVTRRTVDAARHGDASFDPRSHSKQLTAAVGRAGLAPPFSSAFGDRGERGDVEVRTPYTTAGTSPVDRARRRLARALTDTGDARRIRADEFGLVRLDNGRFLVVLPGVVDLSAFDPGWDDRHRSPRDLDRAAIGSSRATGIAANPYAAAVRDTLAGAGVPAGAELMIVGHSFGADTALDLAADREFNGPSGYRVTHVVAAGYHSTPQLPAVASDVEVLVLQNHRDVPVIVEAVGAAGVTEAAATSLAALAALAALDPVTAARQQARSVAAQFGVLRSAGAHLVDRVDDVADVALGIAVGDPARVVDGAAGVVTLEPGVRVSPAGHVVSVFAGGGSGLGHAQRHYVDHVLAVDDPSVVGFLASIDAAGYTAPGVALAVDVSVPG